MDEHALVRKLNQRSRHALELAIRQFTPYVSAVIFRTLKGYACQEDLEELTADVFLTLWRQAGALDPDRSLRPWLAAVARNKARDAIRRRGEETIPLPEDWGGDAGRDPAAEMLRREEAARLWRAVETLPEPDRTLFFRYYYEGDLLKEIAAALGLSETAAKQRLFRGRKTLKQKLMEGVEIQ